jgi:hypothetical protein
VSGQFPYDVLLSRAAEDKPVVRLLGKWLRKDGLKAWVDEWQVKPGDLIPVEIEGALEQSHVPPLFMSANAFGSDWAQLGVATSAR